MIDCSHVKYTYDGEKFVIDDVSLHVAPGEFVCILGGNGSGKSTLAKHMNALLIPDEGRVVVAGCDTAEEDNMYQVRSTCGMVFQNPDDQIVASIVEDDVAFGPENLGIETQAIVERVRESLRDVGLSGFENHETNALSGGQKQRVAIAGVLAMHPKVLVLDEASSMLDPRGRTGLMRVCKELNAAGMTIVMITHFMEEAAEADRVVVLRDGRIVLDGTPDDVLVQADVLAELNLNVPFSCRLALRLRTEGVDVVPHVRREDLADELARMANASDEVPAAAPDALGDESADEPADAPAISAPAADTIAANAASDAAPAASAHALIDFDNVSFTYMDASKQRKRAKKQARKGAKSTRPEDVKWGNDPEAVWALREVNLRVHTGEFLGIAGHTGSGKSTLIQHMNGLLHPTEGRVLVDGADIADKAAAVAARGKVGMVFQYPEHQLFATTVYDDVAFGPRNLGLSEEEVDARVHESLERVGLSFDELHEMSPFELSGGQQRRVAFAGVLAMRPEVLVLDEPVAGLDPAARHDFLELIRRLHARGLTVIMVSHNMDDLASLATRIVILKEGRVYVQGTPAEVFVHGAELKEVGLGMPEPQRMATALAERGMNLPLDVLYDEATLANAVKRELAAGGPAGASEEDAR